MTPLRHPRFRKLALPASVLAVLTVTAAAFSFQSPSAFAHGTMTTPQSRVYACFQGNVENPADPACRAAWEVSGPQTFYNWNGINQANANGNHQAVVPNGKLCSGNNPTFSGLDLPRSDWQATSVSSGPFEFRFRGTAPHATRDWVFYATREGWNPSTPLAWGDLQEFCRLGNTPLSSDGTYHLSCTLPARTGRHVIYTTWQRSDSTEAFYTCTDVKFAGGTTPPPPPTWRDVGALTAQSALAVGTKVTIRVFNSNGTDAERVETLINSGQTSTTAWPLRVGQNVNATSRFARIGVLSNGVITPTASATANRVFLSGTGLTHQVDILAPNTTPPTGYDYVYPNGIGSYVPGATKVKGTDGKIYGCKPAPAGSWCNVNHDAYRPGTGWAWSDAWILF